MIGKHNPTVNYYVLYQVLRRGKIFLLTGCTRREILVYKVGI